MYKIKIPQSNSFFMEKLRSFTAIETKNVFNTLNRVHQFMHALDAGKEK